jgi:hypothetical protein
MAADLPAWQGGGAGVTEQDLIDAINSEAGNRMADDNVEESARSAADSDLDARVSALEAGGGAAAVIPRRAAGNGYRTGRVLAARFDNQTLCGLQWDLTNFTFTTDSLGRPGIEATNWLNPSTIIAKSGFQFGDSDTHLLFEVPASGLHDSNTLKLCARWADANNHYFALRSAHSTTAAARVLNVDQKEAGSASVIRQNASLPDLTPGFWNLRYRVEGPIHYAKAWKVGTQQPGWQIIAIKGDLSGGWLEIGVPALSMQFMQDPTTGHVVATTLVATELVKDTDDLSTNGDFSIVDTGGATPSGLPIGWTIAADGSDGTTSFETATIDGVDRKVARLERLTGAGGGASLTLSFYVRGNATLPRFPLAGEPGFATYLELGLTLEMTDVAHALGDNFLGFAGSVYYWDEQGNPLNTVGGPAGGAQTDYFTGWGPTGEVGGQGATGGIGSTDGFIRQTRCIPLHPPDATDRIDVTLTLHGNTVGLARFTDVTARLVA